MHASATILLLICHAKNLKRQKWYWQETICTKVFKPGWMMDSVKSNQRVPQIRSEVERLIITTFPFLAWNNWGKKVWSCRSSRRVSGREMQYTKTQISGNKWLWLVLTATPVMLYAWHSYGKFALTSAVSFFLQIYNMLI